jgi:hypothetical protein
LEQVTRLLLPGYCANCGRKETRSDPVYVAALGPDLPGRFAIHLKCESPWFVSGDAFHTMPAATIARLFMREEQKRRQQRAQKTAKQARAPNLMPPDDAA